MICYIYHVIIFPKKHCCCPKKALYCPKSNNKCVNLNIAKKYHMLVLKIFVQVQTFRRRTFVPSHHFCQPIYNLHKCSNTEGWNILRKNRIRWLSQKVYQWEHWATILRFLFVIIFLQRCICIQSRRSIIATFGAGGEKTFWKDLQYIINI